MWSISTNACWRFCAARSFLGQSAQPFTSRQEEGGVSLRNSGNEVGPKSDEAERAREKQRTVFGKTGRILVGIAATGGLRSEEHTSELQSRGHLVCRLL